MPTTEKPVPAEITRANQHDVRIKWRDGLETLILARELRLACPCATCVEEMTGRRVLDPSSVAADVHPVSIDVVGRYAVHFSFSDGHGTGIYTFEHLRGLGSKPEAPKPASGPRPAEAAGTPAARSGLTGNSTMAEVLEKFPGAKGALFRRYHVGGCSSCGYEPTDTLEQVMKSHNVLDVQEVIRHIEQSEELNAKVQISPRELKTLLESPKPPQLLDVRTPEEWDIAHLAGARLVDQALAREIMETWPKDSKIVLYCHVGERSLDAASYLIGHGFSNVRSLAGGIEAWSHEIDPSIPTY